MYDLFHFFGMYKVRSDVNTLQVDLGLVCEC